MATEKQILANRANALKSTGTRSPAGKAKCSRNSLRHGILALDIRPDRESHARFIALLEALQTALQPQTARDLALVKIMALADWHKRRLWALEKTLLTREMDRQQTLHQSRHAASSDPCARIAFAFRALADQSRVLDHIHTSEVRYGRQFDRAFDQLTALREKHVFLKQTQFTPSCLTPSLLEESTFATTSVFSGAQKAA
jgi:hypothetical protein